jgi:multidrug transporter EmrE-like cation transporter
MSEIGIILLIVTALFTAVSNVTLRIGLNKAGGFNPSITTLVPDVIRLLSQPFFTFGVICYGLSALIWFRVISNEPLSTAYPLLVSLSFLLITFSAVSLFDEGISSLKWLGLILILSGIVCVSKS